MYRRAPSGNERLLRHTYRPTRRTCQGLRSRAHRAPSATTPAVYQPTGDPAAVGCRRTLRRSRHRTRPLLHYDAARPPSRCNRGLTPPLVCAPAWRSTRARTRSGSQEPPSPLFDRWIRLSTHSKLTAQALHPSVGSIGATRTAISQKKKPGLSGPAGEGGCSSAAVRQNLT